VILLPPALAGAQAPGKIPRIGGLSGQHPPPRGDHSCSDSLRRGLREAGYREGETIAVELRYSEGNTKPWPPLVADLMAMKVDVIVTYTTSATVAAKQATATIPIVMFGPYPVELGLVASLARPGGNVTGVVNFTPEMIRKRVELMWDAVPGVTRLATLRRTGGAQGPAMDAMIADLQAAARRVGAQLSVIDVQRPEDLDRAFGDAVRLRAQGIVLPNSPLFRGQVRRLAELGLRHRLPVLTDEPGAADAGVLLEL
jgi:putative ABC transport system substrate-binding protein